MSKQMTVAIAGLGSRGRDTYAKAAKIYPDKMKIVAIADIDPEKVKLTAEEYDVPMSHCYESAEDMLKEEKLADVMIIATQDRQPLLFYILLPLRIFFCIHPDPVKLVFQEADDTLSLKLL